MQQDTRKYFEQLGRLSNLKLNMSLLASLKGHTHLESLTLTEKQRIGDIYRKSGLIEKAVSVYNDIDINSNKSPKTIEHLAPAGEETPIIHLKKRDKGAGFSSSPLYVVDDFLEQPLLDELIEYTNDNRSRFKHDRRNRLYCDDLGKFVYHFTDYFSKHFFSICDHLEVKEFPIKNFEIKLTNYLDGVFFKRHNDSNPRHEAGRGTRQISWLFYFHHEPKQFERGDLYIFDTNTDNKTCKVFDFTKVGTQNNRLVAFPSCYFHAVEPILLAANDFKNGRMAAGGHFQILEYK